MSEQQGVAGVGVIVAAYTNAEAADQTLDAMKEAKKAASVPVRRCSHRPSRCTGPGPCLGDR